MSTTTLLFVCFLLSFSLVYCDCVYVIMHTVSFVVELFCSDSDKSAIQKRDVDEKSEKLKKLKTIANHAAMEMPPCDRYI